MCPTHVEHTELSAESGCLASPSRDCLEFSKR